VTRSLAQAQAIVTELVELFQRNLDAYRRSALKEAEMRHGFIEPLFEAVSWDAERNQNVVPEESPCVTADLAAPDYALRIGGVRKLYAEVKKPAVNLNADAGPAYQLRRYAWSAKLPCHDSPILRSSRSTSAPSARRSPRRQSMSGIWAAPAGKTWRLHKVPVAVPRADEQHRPAGVAEDIGDGLGVLPGRSKKGAI